MKTHVKRVMGITECMQFEICS